MSDMSLEMIQNNLIDWLDDIVTGVKASHKQIQCVPTVEAEAHYEGYGKASVAERDSVLLHGFKYVVDALQPEVHYCRRQFYEEYKDDPEFRGHPPYAKYFDYDGVRFFDYLYDWEMKNEREQSSDSGTFEELPVLDF